VVLKLVSVVVAFSAVAVFLFCGPFQFWVRCLFSFSGLPLVEYAVQSRNYGIGMLLLFAFGAVYTRKKRRPVLFGVILFLLANTNVHAAVLAGLLLGVWLWDSVAGASAGGRSGWAIDAVGMTVAFCGILLCAYTVRQGGREALGNTLPAPPSAVSAIRSAVGGAGDMFQDVTGVGEIFQHPRALSALGMKGALDRIGAPFLSYLVLVLIIVGLAGRPVLAAAAILGLWTLTGLFTFIYTGFYRHEGLWLVFLITLYWLAQARQYPARLHGPTSLLWQLSVRVALPFLLFVNAATGFRAILQDFQRPTSESRELGALLRSRSDLKQAVVTAEVDYELDPIPYYAGNDLYCVRVSQFCRFASWAPNQKLRLSLAELLSSAKRVQLQTGRPVVILVQAMTSPRGDVSLGMYNHSFHWNEGELAEWRNATHLVAPLHDAWEDAYGVYLLN
jgi:hypothetical protein